ncbi:MAG: hypothetical protein A2Z02_07310 [Chloroflexi bacterium RBG_16_48_7]|nr:MAG: hypothetical protein A2Z02_07310 [Chloroflexi bacterium RBG_16_48_7]
MKRPYVKFRAFYLIWAQKNRFRVSWIHFVICDWLEKFWTDPNVRTGVLKVWRGAGKSTIIALWQAWLIRQDPKYMIILDRSADDDTANKLSAATLDVLQRHPLCIGLLRDKRPGIEKFWVSENKDKRNATVTAYGIMSNATSSRARVILNDDTEVPKNIETPEKRRKLRERLNEEVHIVMPGGKILYVGTDHTHNSLYDEKIEKGYDHLVIPLFEHYKRYDDIDGKQDTFTFPFTVKDPNDLYIISGIYKNAKVFTPDEYKLTLTESGGTVKFKTPPAETKNLDFATGNNWPEYFDRSEIKFKLEECLTLNAWDSQYQLQARPQHDIRLNPEKLVIYQDTPEIRCVNDAVLMVLNGVPLTTIRAFWDCALGKKKSDDSIFAVMLGDDYGRYYWQVMDILNMEVFDQANKVCDRILEYQIGGILIETNGIGGYLPSILRKVMKERGIVGCGILEKNVNENKSKRILQAYESLLSARLIHVHQSVIDNGLYDQMNDWIPTAKDQKDDMLDSGAGCIINSPNKIGKIVKAGTAVAGYQGYRPDGGKPVEVKVDYGQAQANTGQRGTYDIAVNF